MIVFTITFDKPFVLGKRKPTGRTLKIVINNTVVNAIIIIKKKVYRKIHFQAWLIAAWMRRWTTIFKIKMILHFYSF